eukprot:TRINITY_DN19893_c0_g1_i1.p1 TRINITY_DN19893_c0_g1~~TRINITY_DN19893_c0_g1_i1.p1  ORF type:complete len:602 (+),score=169.54 TRINITY_DN19893_c0_g1_i1:66-1808(+)
MGCGAPLLAAALAAGSCGALDPLQWPPQRQPVIWAPECHPFTYPAAAGPQGFTVSVWSYIAREMVKKGIRGFDAAPEQWNFTMVTYTNLWDSKHSATPPFDVVLGCITINADRERLYDFSHPYMEAGLSIMVKEKPPQSLREYFGALVLEFLKLCSVLLMVSLCYAHIMFVGDEKLYSSGVPYFRAVYDGTWLGLVTMTTVGYGDRTPKRFCGRIITMLFMLIALMTYSYFTALLSAKFTEERITAHPLQEKSDLLGRKVGVEKATVSEDYMRAAGANVVPIANTTELYRSVLTGKTEAVVQDRPLLLHWAKQHSHEPYLVQSAIFDRFGFGLMFPQGSVLREHVNEALLRWREDTGGDGQLKLTQEYFSAQPEDKEDTSNLDEYAMLYYSCGIVVLLFLLVFAWHFGKDKGLQEELGGLWTEAGMRTETVAACSVATTQLLAHIANAGDAGAQSAERQQLRQECSAAVAALHAEFGGAASSDAAPLTATMSDPNVYVRLDPLKGAAPLPSQRTLSSAGSVRAPPPNFGSPQRLSRQPLQPGAGGVTVQDLVLSPLASASLLGERHPSPTTQSRGPAGHL